MSWHRQLSFLILFSVFVKCLDIFLNFSLIPLKFLKNFLFIFTNLNFIFYSPANIFSRFSLSRQYAVPETLVEQYKPSSGYTYPSAPQKLQFTHDNNLHIYLFQNKLSLYCATDSTYEVSLQFYKNFHSWHFFFWVSRSGSQNGLRGPKAVGPLSYSSTLNLNRTKRQFSRSISDPDTSGPYPGFVFGPFPIMDIRTPIDKNCKHFTALCQK